MTPLRLRPLRLAPRGGGLGIDPGLAPEVLREGLQGLRPPILDGLRPFANVYRGEQDPYELPDRTHGTLHLAVGPTPSPLKMGRRSAPDQQRLARPAIAGRDGKRPGGASSAACQPAVSIR